MMHAELDGVVCSGARKGKQFTYALLEERAPRAKTLTRDEALGELARRYFTSHGPATLQGLRLVVGTDRRRRQAWDRDGGVRLCSARWWTTGPIGRRLVTARRAT